jgi:hypothetical protein
MASHSCTSCHRWESKDFWGGYNCCFTSKLNETKLRGFGPRANYTDRATAAS